MVSVFLGQGDGNGDGDGRALADGGELRVGAARCEHVDVATGPKPAAREGTAPYTHVAGLKAITCSIAFRARRRGAEAGRGRCRRYVLPHPYLASKRVDVSEPGSTLPTLLICARVLLPQTRERPRTTTKKTTTPKTTMQLPSQSKVTRRRQERQLQYATRSGTLFTRRGS